MGAPVKVAWCNLLFKSNGGQLNEKGAPVFRSSESFHSPRGACSKAFDCGACDIMIQYLEECVSQGWDVGWECIDCLKPDTPSGIERVLPGYYQSGRDPKYPEPYHKRVEMMQLNRASKRQGFREYKFGHYDNQDSDKPWATASITGCTNCGWQSSFLQLVLRRQIEGSDV